LRDLNISTSNLRIKLMKPHFQTPVIQQKFAENLSDSNLCSFECIQRLL